MEVSVTKTIGLNTQYNSLDVPDGALDIADNCVVRRENIIENRRGFNTYGTLGNTPAKLMTYLNTVLAEAGTSISYDNGSGTYTAYTGSYSAPDNVTMKYQEAVNNLYFTSSNGVQVFQDLVGTQARVAGAPKCLDPSYALAGAGSGFLGNGVVLVTTGNTHTNTTLDNLPLATSVVIGTFVTGSGIPAGTTVIAISGAGPYSVTMSAASVSTLTGTAITFYQGAQCAYRCVIQRTDLNKNVLNGYPSSRLWVTNTSSTSDNVTLTLYLPSDDGTGIGAQTNDVIQFYRTESFNGSSVDGAGDECGLIYQYTLTSADIIAGFITFTDSIVDALRGDSLYTNPSQEGIGQANERPPLCTDISLFKTDFMFYANTKTRQRLFFSLTGTGSLNTRTITLAGQTYHFTTAAEDPSTQKVHVPTTGLDAVKLDQTARSLVRIINRNTLNTTVYAYYLSGPEDLPGKILIEARNLSLAPFSIVAGDSTIATQFFPNPPTITPVSGPSLSSNDIAKNRLYYSKAGELEAVPLLNYFNVGPANTSILRIVPLRDSLIVVKEEGVYRVTGDSPSNFSVYPLDKTTFCKSADSVAVISNQVFMLSNQGVVSISDTGVQVMSRDIEASLVQLLGFQNLATYTTAVSYESEREYRLSTMSTSTDTAPVQTFIYNIFTKCWTRWTFGFTTAVIQPNGDKFFFAKSGNVSVYRERKSLDATDHCDADVAITLTSVDLATNTVVFPIPTTSPKVGDGILQNNTDLIINSLTLGTTTYTAIMAGNIPSTWSTGAATLLPSIAMKVVYNSYTAQKPSYLKQFSEFKILADDFPGANTVSTVTATFRSELDSNEEPLVITSTATGWGSPWGDFGWGGEPDSLAYRTWVPVNKQYARQLYAGIYHANAKEKLSIAGVSYVFEMVSERSTK